jgi:hypothetical protein
MKINPSVQLDDVLNYLVEEYEENRLRAPKPFALGELPRFASWGEQRKQLIASILNQIEDDGLIEFYDVPFGNIVAKQFRLTLPGLIFVQNGGYAAEAKKKALEIEDAAQEAKNRRLNDRRLMYGTWFAGAGAFALLLWEILKYFWLDQLTGHN